MWQRPHAIRHKGRGGGLVVVSQIKPTQIRKGQLILCLAEPGKAPQMMDWAPREAGQRRFRRLNKWYQLNTAESFAHLHWYGTVKARRDRNLNFSPALKSRFNGGMEPCYFQNCVSQAKCFLFVGSRPDELCCQRLKLSGAPMRASCCMTGRFKYHCVKQDSF